jgi:hypothetical protein
MERLAYMKASLLFIVVSLGITTGGTVVMPTHHQLARLSPESGLWIKYWIAIRTPLIYPPVWRQAIYINWWTNQQKPSGYIGEMGFDSRPLHRQDLPHWTKLDPCALPARSSSIHEDGPDGETSSSETSPPGYHHHQLRRSPVSHHSPTSPPVCQLSTLLCIPGPTALWRTAARKHSWLHWQLYCPGARPSWTECQHHVF